ncbi:MAG: hypothetical protein M3Z16_09205, partial [Pseudomonadota bacterium]|nr:hypothetical protein [Pseudomonadota bacterium]
RRRRATLHDPAIASGTAPLLRFTLAFAPSMKTQPRPIVTSAVGAWPRRAVLLLCVRSGGAILQAAA